MGNYLEQYKNLWENLGGSAGAPMKAVGGDFAAMGTLEFQLLRMLGLQPQHAVIDVGCGSGRLAAHLAPWLKGPYIGTDILPELLDHARESCGRPDWLFVPTEGQFIPAPDATADFVCFFSVLTHISHEESWEYIRESKRVLRPGGKLVCSFLEFHIRSHWAIFDATARDKAPNKILNQFLSRDALLAFAYNAGFKVETFLDGDKANIPIDGELAFEDGRRVSGFAPLGQSVCVMERPLVPLPPPD